MYAILVEDDKLLAALRVDGKGSITRKNVLPIELD
jgi:hypothetical protein